MNRPENTKMLRRAEVFLKVQCKLMSVAEAARELGVSRKTYYEWENRGLEALNMAMSDRPGGRPFRQEDPRIRQLQERSEQLQLEKEALQMRLSLKEQLAREQKPLSKSKGSKSSKKKKP